MWYHYTLTVPGGTTEQNPVEKEVKLTYGIITHLAAGFPAGCNQLVHVRIYHQEHQIFPNNPDEPASWNSGIEGGTDHYRLVEVPFALKVKGYSPLTTYDHDITIFINVLPLEVAEPWQDTVSSLGKVKRLLGFGS